jgi:fructosamine-3-kinase
MHEGASTPEAAIRAMYGAEVSIRSRTAVGGGCISQTSLLTLSNGERLFLKENGGTFGGMFRTEALGLEALRAAEGPRIPRPFAFGQSSAVQYLLMEYIEQGKRRSDFWDRLGQELAELHRSGNTARYGFSNDNYIGSTPQINSPEETWIRFFGEHRLRYQTNLAVRHGLISSSLHGKMERLIEMLPQLIIEPAGPSLLHGDLWSGNLMTGFSGEPVLIDPAVYHGHREADLAMTELFGGFDRRFYAAYAETFPLDPGYEERRDIYNLYHLLNHLNLFGRSYEAQVSVILHRHVR